MNKAELITRLTQALPFAMSKGDLDKVLTATADLVAGELVASGEATIPGIGKLKVAHREARTGRNPKTGEPVDIAAKSVVKFSAAKALKDAVA